MRVYRTTRGIVIQTKGQFFLSKHTDWDEFISRENLFFSLSREVQFLYPDPSLWDYIRYFSLPPIGRQEIWQLAPTPALLSTASRCSQNDQALRVLATSSIQAGIAILISPKTKFQGITLLHMATHPQQYPYPQNGALGPSLWVPEPDVAGSWEISTEIVRGNQIILQQQHVFKEISPGQVESFWNQQNFAEGAYLAHYFPIAFTPQAGDRIKSRLASLGSLLNYITI